VPTVVIEAGTGGTAAGFAAVQAALESRMRVCTYDRAGNGFSDAGSEPRTGGVIAEELHSLLHAAGVMPPLVLAGHSFGGLVVRIYQARYPDEVGALVLLDAAHPEQFSRLVGASSLLDASIAAMPPGAAAEMRALDETLAQVPGGPLPADLPIVMLTARNSFEAFRASGLSVDDNNRIWAILQDELAALSPHPVRLYSDADHRLPVTDPGAVAAAIERAVNQTRARDRVWPAALGLPLALPEASTREADGLLLELEEAYRSGDLALWGALFTEDFTQLDVPRRVHVVGHENWMTWTSKLNDLHVRMERRHRGRLKVGNLLVAEVEWSGVLRAAAVGSPADTAYRYTGVVIMELEGRRIRRQIVFGDERTLDEQLRAGRGPG
jgi:pimeloyl-ACP methyl ester carboxylesterase